MKIKWQKILSMVLTVTIITSLFCVIQISEAATEKFKVDTIIESEKTTLSRNVEVTRDKNASGKKYAQIIGEKVTDKSLIKEADFSFCVDIPEDGVYYTYARVIVDSMGRDSFFVNWDNDAWKTVSVGEIGTDYVWVKIHEQELSKGERVFNWHRREVGAVIDCFFVTNDESKIPSDAPLFVVVKTPTPTPTPPEIPGYVMKSYNIKNGSVYVEAEDNVSGTTVVVTENKKASEKKAVLFNVKDTTAPAAGSHSGISFEVVCEKSGYYEVWARIVCKSMSQDSCWFSINNAAYKNFNLGTDSEDDEDFYWVKLGTSVFTPGSTNCISVVPREMGAVVDRFLVTSNTTFIPEGTGEIPPELKHEVVKFPDNVYPIPTITPPSEHPRLLFRTSDIETIKKNMEHEENAHATKQFKFLAETEFDGILSFETTPNYSGDKLGIIEAKAFDYAINGNEENGRAAIKAIKNYADTCTYEGDANYTRAMGHILFTAGEVYDWCYPLLTETDKEEIIIKCQIIGRQMEIGFPPSGQGAVSGHGGEAQLMRDWLSLAIACYDEYPDIYNFVAGRYLSEFVEARNYWFASETQHQGSSYGHYRYAWDLWGQWIIYRMTGDVVYTPEAGQVPYQWIYTRRPDGQFLREGDDSSEQTDGSNVNYWKSTTARMNLLASGFYKDPILKKQLLRDNNELSSFTFTNITATPVQIILFNDPNVGKEDITSLPLTKYFKSPLGQMIARTGWNMGINSPDVLAYMRIGEVWAANHHHRDAGNFQIYYKGILASESGFYDSYNTNHDLNYNKQSIAHNTFIITSAENPKGIQRTPGKERKNLQDWMQDGLFETGEVIGHEFGPDTRVPEYSYIAGDIARAYDANVEEALRSMIFLPTGNSEYPAAFVVFDKITTKEQDSKKTFALHMQHEPSIEGNVSIIKNAVDGYNGQLTNQTLLPKDASIEKIGGEGKEFWLDGVNYALEKPIPYITVEEGWGRIEISETGTNKTDYFLNVMYVGDADKNLPLQKAELIEGNGVTGAKILDRVAMFNNNKERTKNTVSFTVGGEGEVKVNVAGLETGTWAIKANGTDLGTQIASEDGGIIYFAAPAGYIELSYVSDDANKTFTTSEAPYNEGVAVKVNTNYAYSDVNPTIRDGRTLLPLRAIFEALEANVSWDAATATATAVRGKVTVKITENQTTAYVNDKAVELDVPATIIDGRFVVPVRFVSESLGAKVEWDELSSLVKITLASAKKGMEVAFEEGYATIASSSASECSEAHVDTNAYDLDAATLWSAQGEHYVDFVLDKEYEIDAVDIMLNQNKNRNALFEILYSTDGVNYISLYDGKGDGVVGLYKWETFEFAPVTAKYFRYFAKGSNVSMWNGLQEIRFRIKK